MGSLDHGPPFQLHFGREIFSAVMKSLLLLSIVLASAAIAVAAANDGPPADDKVIDEIADKDGYDHHDSKYRYCCYEVKKYLENRITNAENRAGTLIDQLRKSIKAN